MSALSQALGLSEPKPGKAADIFGWSGCPVRWCELRTIPSEGANCLTALQHLAVWSSDIRHLRTVAPCRGSMHANGGSAAKFGHYLFRDCINLATFVLLEDGRQREPQAQAETRELPPGCLSSTGIITLESTRDFQVLGAHACDNCKLLQHVDISNSSIEEIQELYVGLSL